MSATAAAPANANETKNRRMFPKDADEILALNRQEINRMYYEAVIQMGRARRKRGALLSVSAVDQTALSLVNGKISHLGSLLCVLLARRTFFRISHRHSLGLIPERAEAIARAVDSLLSKDLHRKIQAEADRLLAQAAADLVADPNSQPELP